MGDAVSIGLCVGVGDHQTDIVAHKNNGAVDLKVLAQEPMNVSSHRALVVPARWPVGMARAPVVWSDDAKAGVRKYRNHMAPLPPCLWKSVEEHDRAFSPACRYAVEA